MDTHLDSIAQRVDAAIEHLTSEQIQRLQARHPDAPGVRALVAMACGVSQVSFLSDITSGRKPGTKYHPQLAKVLGVQLAWLDGTGGEAPDWALSQVKAWRRFEERLRRKSDAIDEDDSEQPERTRRYRISPYALEVANTLGIDVEDVQALAHGRYVAVPFETVLTYAERLGMPKPIQVEHLRQGHALWVLVLAELQQELQLVRKRFHRYIPPPHLFDVIRQALLALPKPEKAPRSGSPDGPADALEMLWRQQWMLVGKSRSILPGTFRDDTGRDHWQRLDEIRERWLNLRGAGKVAGL